MPIGNCFLCTQQGALIDGEPGIDATRIVCSSCQTFTVYNITLKEWKRIQKDEPDKWKKLQPGFVAYIQKQHANGIRIPKIMDNWEQVAKQGLSLLRKAP